MPATRKRVHLAGRYVYSYEWKYLRALHLYQRGGKLKLSLLFFHNHFIYYSYYTPIYKIV